MKFTKLIGRVGAFLLISAGAFAGTIKVGATPVPHAEILELIKPDLKKQGVELKIVEFTDYVITNWLYNLNQDDNYNYCINHYI